MNTHSNTSQPTAILGGAKPESASNRHRSAAKPLRVLILGGTGYIGPHFARAALERGHAVSVFNRGQSQAQLPSCVERLIGDRNCDLQSIKNRDWDAVFDLATFVPSWVRSLGQALNGRVGHYSFISTCAVYEYPRINQQLDEFSPVRTLKESEDPYLMTRQGGIHEYGALKVICETEAQNQFPGKTVILRPGQIVGPGNHREYLAYWPVRFAKGGEVLIAGDPTDPIQFTDARDLADWSVRLAEGGTTGVFNAAGPATPTNFGQFIDLAGQGTTSSHKVTWVPASWLRAQKHPELWGRLLFWSREPEGWTWSMQMNVEKALGIGFTPRHPSTTLSDTFAWYETLSEREQAELLWSATESGLKVIPWQDYLACEREVLDVWREQRI